MLERTTTTTALELALSDPSRRNALGREMFDALESALRDAAEMESAWVRGGRDAASAPPPVLLRGVGPAFCAGFDLGAAAADPDGPGERMGEFIDRLSGVLRMLRRHPAPVIAVVHGAALAGGCALLSACDLVVVAADATLGYPVHRIGVSPAVTSPTLAAAIGAGAARGLLLSGELIDGARALALGLATHGVATAEEALIEGRRLAALLAEKGPVALRATKAWLNQLDGTADGLVFQRAASASRALVEGEEARSMLAAFWQARR